LKLRKGRGGTSFIGSNSKTKKEKILTVNRAQEGFVAGRAEKSTPRTRKGTDSASCEKEGFGNEEGYRVEIGEREEGGKAMRAVDRGGQGKRT